MQTAHPPLDFCGVSSVTIITVTVHRFGRRSASGTCCCECRADPNRPLRLTACVNLTFRGRFLARSHFLGLKRCFGRAAALQHQGQIPAPDTEPSPQRWRLADAVPAAADARSARRIARAQRSHEAQHRCRWERGPLAGEAIPWPRTVPVIRCQFPRAVQKPLESCCWRVPIWSWSTRWRDQRGR